VAGAVIGVIIAPFWAMLYPLFTSETRHQKEMGAMLTAVEQCVRRHGRMPMSMAEVVESMDDVGVARRDAVALNCDYVLILRSERPEQIKSFPILLWMGPDSSAPLMAAMYGRGTWGRTYYTPRELAEAIEKDVPLSNAIARAIERQHDSPNLREVWSIVQRRAGTVPLRP
jgi:hypothetical protein